MAIRYRPLSLIQSVKQEMDRLFYSAFQDYPLDSTDLNTNWQPRVDIREESDCYIVNADIPGVDPKNIKVSIDNNTLTIQGEKVIENRTEDKNFQRMERYSGSFYRQFTLPANVDGKNIKAKSKHGVLELTLPKTKAAETKYIEVKGDD